jgi:hypothetical protein
MVPTLPQAAVFAENINKINPPAPQGAFYVVEARHLNYL